MKVPADRPRGNPNPRGDKTPNAPKRPMRGAKVGVMGKDDDGSRKHYHRGLLSGKKR